MAQWSNGENKVSGTPAGAYDDANTFQLPIPSNQDMLSLYLDYRKGDEANIDIRIGVYALGGEIYWLSYTTGATNVNLREFHVANAGKYRIDVGINKMETRILVGVKRTGGTGTGKYSLMAEFSHASPIL